MNNDLVSYIESFAQEVAELGHSVRTENLENVENINSFAEKISHIADTISNRNLTESLSMCYRNMIAAYESRDAVTLADILEYEILHALEKTLS